MLEKFFKIEKEIEQNKKLKKDYSNTLYYKSLIFTLFGFVCITTISMIVSLIGFHNVLNQISIQVGMDNVLISEFFTELNFFVANENIFVGIENYLYNKTTLPEFAFLTPMLFSWGFFCLAYISKKKVLKRGIYINSNAIFYGGLSTIITGLIILVSFKSIISFELIYTVLIGHFYFTLFLGGLIFYYFFKIKINEKAKEHTFKSYDELKEKEVKLTKKQQELAQKIIRSEAQMKKVIEDYKKTSTETQKKKILEDLLDYFEEYNKNKKETDLKAQKYESLIEAEFKNKTKKDVYSEIVND